MPFLDTWRSLFGPVVHLSFTGTGLAFRPRQDAQAAQEGQDGQDGCGPHGGEGVRSPSLDEASDAVLVQIERLEVRGAGSDAGLELRVAEPGCHNGKTAGVWTVCRVEADAIAWTSLAGREYITYPKDWREALRDPGTGPPDDPPDHPHHASADDPPPF